MKINKLSTQLKGMTIKNKIEHIWEYYKYLIISILCLVFILSYSVAKYQSYKTSILTVALFENGITAKQIAMEEANIKQKLFKEIGIKKKVTLLSMNSGNDAQTQNMLIQKFLSQVSVGSIDVVIMPNKEYQKDVHVGMFKKLDNKLIKELNLVDKEIMRYQRDQDEKKHIYAIKLDSNTKFKKLGFDSENKFLAIVATSKNYDNAEKFVRWFIKR